MDVINYRHNTDKIPKDLHPTESAASMRYRGGAAINVQ